MSEPIEPDFSGDSLGETELLMISELVTKGLSVWGTPPSNPGEIGEVMLGLREKLRLAMEQARFGDDDYFFDDDALGSLVRNPGPGNSPGRAGAAVKPETNSFERGDDVRFDRARSSERQP